MVFRKIFKNRGLAVNMIASLSFIVLAVYGWGLSWRELLGYVGVLLICLVGVVGLAMLAGFLLRKLMHKKDNDNETH